mmetsp:Transcript_74531/g.228091  ORF Transcript_74531/g.228091 Transcript_74531/m.228091 type:complete len:281 (+) Transcript_74531:270-1112(+)
MLKNCGACRAGASAERVARHRRRRPKIGLPDHGTASNRHHRVWGPRLYKKHCPSASDADRELKNDGLPALRAVDPRSDAVVRPIGGFGRAGVIHPIAAPLAARRAGALRGAGAVAVDARGVRLLISRGRAGAIPDALLRGVEVAGEGPSGTRRARGRLERHLGAGVGARQAARLRVERLVAARRREAEPRGVVRVGAKLRPRARPSAVQLDVIVGPRAALQAPRDPREVVFFFAGDVQLGAAGDTLGPALQLDGLFALVVDDEPLDVDAAAAARGERQWT